jgi:hypothetical protein
MEMNRLLFTLALRAGRYRFLKATGRPGRLEALSLEVTRRCVARCVMCNIWRMRPDQPELDAAGWPLFHSHHHQRFADGQGAE